MKRLRRVKGQKKKSGEQNPSSPSPTKSKGSTKVKNKTAPSSTWAYEGILQDLSINDISSFDSREYMDVILDENLDGGLASAEEEEESLSEDDSNDEQIRFEDHDHVLSPLKLEPDDH